MKKDGIVGHSLQLQRLGMMLRNDKIPQTLLFSGIPGIGKRRIALRFFKTLFCTGAVRPCLSCPACHQILKGTHPDVIELHPNTKGTIPIGASDEEGTVRWLIDRLSKKSVSGRYGVIVNGVDRIPVQGQNALLKTIEEPPHGAVIVLVTSNKSLILPTILSRSTEIPFYRLSAGDVCTILDRHGITGPHRTSVAGMSGGSVELAVMLMEEENLNAILKLTEEICRFVDRRDFLNLDIESIQKKIGAENLLSIMINIFRTFLLGWIDNTGPQDIFSHISPPGEEDLRRIIKIFLSLQRGLAVNLNIPQALKGMLYSMNAMDETGLPGIDMAHLDGIR